SKGRHDQIPRKDHVVIPERPGPRRGGPQARNGTSGLAPVRVEMTERAGDPLSSLGGAQANGPENGIGNRFIPAVAARGDVESEERAADMTDAGGGVAPADPDVMAGLPPVRSPFDRNRTCRHPSRRRPPPVRGFPPAR